MRPYLGPLSLAMVRAVERSLVPCSLNIVLKKVPDSVRGYHSDSYYFRRLVALALEKYIIGKVHRDGDKVSFRFYKKRLPEGQEKMDPHLEEERP